MPSRLSPERSGRGRDVEHARQLARGLRGRDVGGKACVVDEGAVETRGLAVREHVGGDVHRRIVVVEHRRRVPGERQARQLHAVLEHEAGRRRQPRVAPRMHHRRSGRDLAEVALDERERGVGVDIAGNRNRRVRRVVERAEELAGVLHARRHEVGRRANRDPRIRMVGREQRLGERHARQTVGPVLVVLPPFVQHDLAFGRELLFAQGRQQVAHAIRFHPQRQFQRLRRHDFPVVGAVGIGRAVHEAAGFLQGLEVAGRMVRRALEHQVFEEVGKAGAPGLLVPRADVVPHAHGRHRDVAVFVHDDVEAVRERVCGVGNVHRVRRQTAIVS